MVLVGGQIKASLLTRFLSFCCTPPRPLVGVSIAMERGCQQTDRTLVKWLKARQGVNVPELQIDCSALTAKVSTRKQNTLLGSLLVLCCRATAMSVSPMSERFSHK